MNTDSAVMSSSNIDLSMIPFQRVSLKECSNFVEFNPKSIGLPANFVLTDYSGLKG